MSEAQLGGTSSPAMYTIEELVGRLTTDHNHTSICWSLLLFLAIAVNRYSGGSVVAPTQ